MSFSMIGKGRYLDSFLNQLKMTYSIHPQWIRITKFNYGNSTFELAFDDVFESVVMNYATEHRFIRKFE